MAITIDEKDLSKFVLVGDKVLIKPKNPMNTTKSGLYLPPSVHDTEKVQSGYVLKTGPGYPIPAITDNDEFWKESKDQVKYVPLQAREGDLAIFLQKSGFEIEFKNEKYIIVPHSAIQMLIRDEEIFT